MGRRSARRSQTASCASRLRSVLMQIKKGACGPRGAFACVRLSAAACCCKQGELVSAMNDKKEAEKAKVPTPRDIFVGIKGRSPKTDRELEEWLASPEGKTASMFEPSSTTRWGEGRS